MHLHLSKVVFALAFFIPQFSFGLTIHNHSKTDCEVVLSSGQDKEPDPQFLRSGEQLTLDPVKNLSSGHSSLKVTLLTQPPSKVEYPLTEKESVLEIHDPITSATSTWSSWVYSIVNSTTYFGGLILSSSAGTLVGIAEGSKWGGLAGVHLAQQMLLGAHPVVQVFLGPINPVVLGSGKMLGIAAGSTVGGVVGGIALPIVFKLSWRALSALLAYTFSRSHTRELPALIGAKKMDLESDWIDVHEDGTSQEVHIGSPELGPEGVANLHTSTEK